MSTPKWTPSQLQAIEARGGNLLVSAGAGAGKTAALIERIYRIITDPRDPATLESLLVVTFTRAAAGEMKERLGRRLREELAQAAAAGSATEEVRRLRGQLAVLPRASISTLHSFCLNLLREHAEKVGLPPDFDLMAEEEALLLRRDLIDAEIEDTLRDEKDGPVLRDMLAQLSPSEGAGMLADELRRLHSFLESLADPEEWIAEVLAAYEAAASDSPLADHHYGRSIHDLVEKPLRDVEAALNDALAGVSGSDLTKKSVQTWHDGLLEMRERVQTLLTDFDEDAPLPDFAADLKLPRRPPSNLKDPTGSEARLIDGSAGTKDRVDAAKAKLGAIATGMTLRGLCEEIGQCEGMVRLLLGRLGPGLIEKILQRHREQRRLTFAHLERLALKLLRESEDVRRELRQRYDYVLVDEFQDVNELQATLLKAAAREGREGNLFVVGDVKQSIYGFRQADPRQFLERAATYARYADGTPIEPPGARVVLRENFRSAPALLRELNALFERLFAPDLGGVAYDEEHAFVPGRPEAEAEYPRLDVHVLEGTIEVPDQESGGEDDEAGSALDDMPTASDQQEARYVASLIRDAGVPYKDIAVLLRSASGTATTLVEELQRAGIPYHTQESLGFLVQQEVNDVLSLLRVISNPYDDVALVGMLRGPAAEWNENDLVRLRLSGRGGRLFDLVKKAAAADDETLGAKAKVFLERLRAWQHAARHEGMGRFFARLYDDLSLRERVAVLPNGDSRIANLDFLHQRAVQFDQFRRKGITQFLRFLEDLIERGDDLGQPPAAAPGEDVVRIMTMHKSKGLQFPVVILPFLGRRMNMRDLSNLIIQDRDAGFSALFFPGRRYGEDRWFPARELMKDAIAARVRSEELRLLYVAMTRAEERLLLTGSARNAAKRIATAQALSAEPPEALAAACASATTFLDWVLSGVSGAPEFGDLTPEGPIVTARGGSPRVSLVESPAGADAAAEPLTEEERRAAARARITDAKKRLDDLFERLHATATRDDAAPLRGKVSATEAKRAWEAIHSADNPPAKFRFAKRPGRKGAAPDWFPQALQAEAGRPVSPRRAGTLTHRFCALLDFDAIAKAGTKPDEITEATHAELARLTAEHAFTAEEANLVRADDVAGFFTVPLGRRVLDSRAKIRREVPFTIRLNAGEVMDVQEGADEVLIFQGVVDLLFEDAHTGDLVLLDYKTDWWDGTADHYDELVRAYTPQIRLYRLGLERALGRSVDEAHLYFLRAQQNEAIPAAEKDDDWREYLKAAYRMENG